MRHYEIERFVEVIFKRTLRSKLTQLIPNFQILLFLFLAVLLLDFLYVLIHLGFVALYLALALVPQTLNSLLAFGLCSLLLFLMLFFKPQYLFFVLLLDKS